MRRALSFRARHRGDLIFYGGISGIVLSVSFAAMWSLAVAVNGDWVLGRDTLSELGGDVPSRDIFNRAVIVSGLLGLSFSLALAAQMAPSRSGRAGSYVLLVACIGLIAVGVFPIDAGRPHLYATIAFFGPAGVACLLLAYALAGMLGTKSWQFILTLAIVVISLASLALTTVPFAEAVAVACLLVWCLLMSIWMLRDRGGLASAEREAR